MSKSPALKRAAYGGFEMDPKPFLGGYPYACMSVREIGVMMRRIGDALAAGDEAYLRSHPFIGRLLRPKKKRETVSPSVRRAVFARDGRICRHCAATDRLEIDHIIPVVWGGSDSLDNLQVLCKPCNLKKGPVVNAPRPEWLA